jgi:hypothetical protein
MVVEDASKVGKPIQRVRKRQFADANSITYWKMSTLCLTRGPEILRLATFLTVDQIQR